MKRPLCLFVLAFSCISLILQIMTGYFGSASVKSRQGGGQLNEIYEQASVSVSGQIQKKEEKKGKSIYYLKDVQILEPVCEPTNLAYNPLGVVCYMEESVSVYEEDALLGRNDRTASIGQWLIVRGSVSFYDKAENEGQFDAAAYYEGLGYHFKLYDATIVKQGRNYDRLGEWLFQKQQKCRLFLQKHMQTDNAGILTAMLLGDKTAMDGDIKRLYQKSGIAHVLAISGLHISLLGMLLYRFLRKCFLPIPICSLLGISMICLYGKMTGFSTSSFRAICMFIIFLLAEVVGRSYDLLTAMAFAAFLSYLNEPEIIFEAGFLLSYLAVLGLAVVNPRLKQCFYEAFADRGIIKKWLQNKKKTILVKVIDSLLASLSTQIMIFPVQLWFYYEFSFYSLLLNLIIIPCMSVILLSGIAGCVSGIPVFLIPAEVLLNLYEWLCTWSRGLPHSLIITGRPAIWQLLLYYILILAWLYISRIKNERTGILVVRFLSPLLCMLLFLIPVHWEDRIDFLSVGQGDCACMRDVNGNVVLIDGGSTDKKETGKYRLIPFLKYNGISYIDIVFISHAHEDHYSSIVELLEMGEEEGISVGTVCVSSYGRGRKEYEVVAMAAQRAGARMLYIEKGDQVSCGRMHFLSLYPAVNAKVTEENDASLVLYGEYSEEGERIGNRNADAAELSVLFTGDSTRKCDAEVVKELQQRGLEKITLLKVAHHGSRESTGEELLTQIAPAVAVISCGLQNSYGHPHQETVERLEKVGSLIFTTPECGGVTVKSKTGICQIKHFCGIMRENIVQTETSRKQVRYEKNCSRYRRTKI